MDSLQGHRCAASLPFESLTLRRNRLLAGWRGNEQGIPSRATAARRPFRPHEMLARRFAAAAVHWTAYACGYLPAFL